MADSRQMAGLLYVRDDDALCRRAGGGARATPWAAAAAADGAPCYVPVAQTRYDTDYFELGALLAAAGVTLDTPNALAKEGAATPLRHTGAKLLLYIEYINRAPWRLPTTDSAEIVYVYRPRVAPGAYHHRFRTTETAHTFPRAREVTDNFGIEIYADSSGTIYQYSFGSLLLSLTTSLALLAVANLVTMLLAKFCWARELYDDAKFHEMDAAAPRSSRRLVSEAGVRQMLGATNYGALNRAEAE